LPRPLAFTLFPYTTLFRSRDQAWLVDDARGAVTPGTVHDATDVARRHAHARVVAQALDLAGVAARHHPQALDDDSEPDRRAHLGAIAPKRREPYVPLAPQPGP